jgi:hypothetical protein
LETTPIHSIKDLFIRPKMVVLVGTPYSIHEAQNKTIEEVSMILVNSFIRLRYKSAA